MCALPRANENKSAFPHLFSLWGNSHFPIPLCAIRKIKFAYSVKTFFAKTVLLTWYFISKQVWHKISSIILLRQKGGIFIAIYHCSIKIISRGKGKSAVAAAAYRSGKKLINNYDGITHDYTRKSGIAYTEIMLPSHAPPDFQNRTVLWNSVEKIEKSKNSQLAREIELAIPKELNREQQISLVREYVNDNFAA